MNSDDYNTLTSLVNATPENITFDILEIGALPVNEDPEPFHKLLDDFPGSRIFAFEVDEELCRDLNKSAKTGLTYYPVALGRTNAENVPFYNTNHPMCSSLYKPNEKLIGLYNNLEVALLKSLDSVKTVTLDSFAKENRIDTVDLIKIDVQGAELDIFEAGVSVLGNTVAIVTEVEFIQIYENQPLFGDVCSFLAQHDLGFHKFLGLCGRSLKPIVVNNDPNHPVQHMWSDAVFIKDPVKIEGITSNQLLKLAILAFIYDSPDVTYFCLNEYDKRNGTRTAFEIMRNK